MRIVLPTTARAIAKINKAGALLVFPIKGKSDLPSLWDAFYPDHEMNWDWSEEGDGRVPSLWHLRTDLSTSGKVVYSKWFRDRATCFSLELFTAFLSLVSSKTIDELKLSKDAQNILNALYDNSPLPTRELKIIIELHERENNGKFDRALKELWRKFLIVGYGEVDEGGFPSLAIGGSKLIFEDLWDASCSISADGRRQVVEGFYRPGTPFHAFYLKIERGLSAEK